MVLINTVLKLSEFTLDNENAIDAPTINKNQGITKSANVTPFQGEWFIWGYASPTSSTKIIIIIVIPLKTSKLSNLTLLGIILLSLDSL